MRCCLLLTSKRGSSHFFFVAWSQLGPTKKYSYKQCNVDSGRDSEQGWVEGQSAVGQCVRSPSQAGTNKWALINCSQIVAFNGLAVFCRFLLSTCGRVASHSSAAEIILCQRYHLFLSPCTRQITAVVMVKPSNHDHPANIPLKGIFCP